MKNPLIPIAATVEHIADKLRVNPSLRWHVVQKARQHLNVERQTNLAAALTFFQAYPSKTVDHERLKNDIHQAQGILVDLENSIQTAPHTGSDIPKTIWMYWHSGLENAPEVVQIAYKSWQGMNPDYEVRFLDDEQARAIIDIEQLFKIASIELGIAHKSDFLRTYLLCRYGGVWADSTTFCWRPLSSWLPQETASTGFFIFRQPEERKDRQITNWFIASSQKNPIICKQFEALCRYIFKPRDIMLKMRKPRHYYNMENISRTGTGYALLDEMERRNTYPYFFYHYLFNEVVALKEARATWRKVLQKSNNHAKNNGEIGDAYISKQTHKGQYSHSNTYKERKAEILSRLEANHAPPAY